MVSSCVKAEMDPSNRTTSNSRFIIEDFLVKRCDKYNPKDVIDKLVYSLNTSVFFKSKAKYKGDFEA
jgi:hypothetical protein